MDVRVLSTLGLTDDDLEALRATDGVVERDGSLRNRRDGHHQGRAACRAHPLAARRGVARADTARRRARPRRTTPAISTDPCLVEGAWPARRRASARSWPPCSWARRGRAHRRHGDASANGRNAGRGRRARRHAQLHAWWASCARRTTPPRPAWAPPRWASGSIHAGTSTCPRSDFSDGPCRYTEAFVDRGGRRGRSGHPTARPTTRRVAEADRAGHRGPCPCARAGARRRPARRRPAQSWTTPAPTTTRGKADADAQLADAKAQLDDAAAAIVENERKLADGQAAYESGRAQLDGQKAATDERLSQAQAQLDDGQAALDAQKPQLDAAAEMLEGAWAQWEQRSAGLAQGWKTGMPRPTGSTRRATSCRQA